MTISNEAILAAGKAFYGDAWDDVEGESVKYAVDQLRSMLEATAPIIRAEALEEAAEDHEADPDLFSSDRQWVKGRRKAIELLRARALAERGRQ